jgi:hypothetical protein
MEDSKTYITRASIRKGMVFLAKDLTEVSQAVAGSCTYGGGDF